MLWRIHEGVSAPLIGRYIICVYQIVQCFSQRFAGQNIFCSEITLPLFPFKYSAYMYVPEIYANINN